MATNTAEIGWRGARSGDVSWLSRPGAQLGGAVLADTAAIAVGASVLGAWGAMALHALVAGAFIAVSLRSSSRQLTIAAAILALAGPPAAMAWWIAGTRAAARTPEERARWYDVIALDGGSDVEDDASQLHEAIANGRIGGVHRRGDRSFPDILANGTLGEKQGLLGLIGLRYHPRYYPLLQAALRSPEPSVRAQAAAVSVKLKDQFRARLACALAAPGSSEPDDVARAHAEDILAAASSGFIDPPQARAALASAVALCERRLTGESDDQWLILLVRCLSALERHADVVARLLPLGADVPAELRPLLDASQRALGRSVAEVHAGEATC